MAYDKNGNWDYSGEADHSMFRRRAGAESRARFFAMVGTIVVALLFVVALVGISVSGWYVQGRAMGAGVRDSLEKPAKR